MRFPWLFWFLVPVAVHVYILPGLLAAPGPDTALIEPRAGRGAAFILPGLVRP